jgi:hypothetical protein
MPSGPATLELMSGTISSGIGVYLGVHGVSRKRPGRDPRDDDWQSGTTGCFFYFRQTAR